MMEEKTKEIILKKEYCNVLAQITATDQQHKLLNISVRKEKKMAQWNQQEPKN